MASTTAERSDLHTVEQLASLTGVSVRTIRYYGSLGLLPAPERHGRVAWYAPEHRARLELIRSLQEHGFTLAAIERYLGGVPLDASPEELSVQRALLTAWTPGRWDVVTERELTARAGRRLSAEDLRWLERAGAVRRAEGAARWSVHPKLAVAVALIDTGLDPTALTDAHEAVTRHMAELADELSAVLRTKVISDYPRSGLTSDEAERLERTLGHLRSLTLDAIVDAFQRAAHQLATRSLSSER